MDPDIVPEEHVLDDNKPTTRNKTNMVEGLFIDDERLDDVAPATTMTNCILRYQKIKS